MLAVFAIFNLNLMENNYIITGGDEGKKRLAILADILQDQTKALIEIAGPISGKRFCFSPCLLQGTRRFTCCYSIRVFNNVSSMYFVI